MSVAEATVYIVDDDVTVLTSLRRLIEAHGLQAKTFSLPDEFLRCYDSTIPGCLVLDLEMPNLSGLEVQARIAAQGGVCPPIIFLSGHGDLTTGVAAMKGGAADFLTKPASSDELMALVRRSIERDRQTRREYAESDLVRRRLATLTRREREVLHHVVAGKLNKQIAAELGTVEKTVKVHRGRMMRKMQAKSIADLVQLALRVNVRRS